MAQSVVRHGGTRPDTLRNIALRSAIAIALFSALAAIPPAQAQTYSVLYNFTGRSDGGYPAYGTLVLDKAGNLYGTTQYGGTSDWGTVFEVAPETGVETVLYNFTGGTDGGAPSGGPVLSGKTLYGTTYAGGSGEGYGGAGVVFQVDITTRTEKVLYTFIGGADGGYPFGRPVLGSGVLYGAAWAGGSSDAGVVYKVVIKTGAETVLHTFDGLDGQQPGSALALDPTGSILYGTTIYGGSSNAGVVFSLAIKTGQYTVLWNFTGGTDGANPVGSLHVGPGGTLYGTTNYGGSNNCSSGCGVVFKVAPLTKTETVVYSFIGSDGAYPLGGVVQDTAGNLFGTTYAGGSSSCYNIGCGTVFEIDMAGKETVLHSFDWGDGANPYDGLLHGANGIFYGTARLGGSGGDGVVFSLYP